MLAYEESRFRKFDLSVLLISIVLIAIGIFNLRSATRLEISTHEAGLYKKQLVFVGIGFGAILISLFLNYRILERLAYFIWGINTLALGAIFIAGRTSLGATRWLNFGFINFQPSEFMKLSLVIVLAKYFSQSRRLNGHGFRDLLPALFLVGIPAALTILQPDFGTGVMMFLIFGSIALFVKIKPRVILIILMVALPAGFITFKYGLKSYQQKRIITFLNPAHDPHGAGYNTIQSMIAVGSGQITGKGYMKGTQSRLSFLPEQHTDFIFSVFNEEWGFLGSCILLGFFATLLLSGIRIAGNTNDKFGAILAIGITAIYFWHILINLCMVIGLAPVVGIPLPFLSYGGSSLILNMLGIAILTNIANKKFMF